MNVRLSVFLAVMVFFGAIAAHSQNVGPVSDPKETLRIELKLIPEEFRIIDASLSNLLKRGAALADVRLLLLRLREHGVRRVDFLKDPLDGMNDLLKRGRSVSDVFELVWAVLSELQAQGFKADDLALRLTAELKRKAAIIDKLKERQDLEDNRLNQKGEKEFK